MAKFNELFKRKAYFHVYEKVENFDSPEAHFTQALENCKQVSEEYFSFEKQRDKVVSDEDIDAMWFKPSLLYFASLRSVSTILDIDSSPRSSQ